MSEDAIIANTETGEVRGGKVSACAACGHFACVCTVTDRHDEGCRFRRAMACPVAIECDHGRDVCPVCDPCTCGKGVEAADFGEKQ